MQKDTVASESEDEANLCGQVSPDRTFKLLHHASTLSFEIFKQISHLLNANLFFNTLRHQ